jgi:hypothetical protein
MATTGTSLGFTELGVSAGRGCFADLKVLESEAIASVFANVFENFWRFLNP